MKPQAPQSMSEENIRLSQDILSHLPTITTDADTLVLRAEFDAVLIRIGFNHPDMSRDELVARRGKALATLRKYGTSTDRAGTPFRVCPVENMHSDETATIRISPIIEGLESSVTELPRQIRKFSKTQHKRIRREEAAAMREAEGDPQKVATIRQARVFADQLHDVNNQVMGLLHESYLKIQEASRRIQEEQFRLIEHQRNLLGITVVHSNRNDGIAAA